MHKIRDDVDGAEQTHRGRSKFELKCPGDYAEELYSPVSRSVPIVDRAVVFIRFKALKDLSAEHVVTGSDILLKYETFPLVLA